MTAHALEAALTRLYAVRPTWRAVRSARDAVGLAPMTLLHAGPPFADPRRPSAPVLSSAVLCCLYEGWAESEAQAEALIASGEVQLRPAQTFRVVTPLAAVISPRTALVEIGDAARPDAPCAWSLLGSGAGPQIRFGTRDSAVLERLRWRDQVLAPALERVLQADTGIVLIPLAVAGLRGGDDLHSRTTDATAALWAELAPHIDDASVRTMFDNTPLFFLTLWMAACYLMLDATCGADAALVIALAGNGIDAGVRLAHDPARWITTPAHVPSGPRLAPGSLPASPMLGDSGVIDAAGFGAQAWQADSEVAAPMKPWTPPTSSDRPAWLIGAHPEFNEFPLGSALDAGQISAALATPRVAIAMLDAEGRIGLLGRGVCLTDPALFGATTSPDQPSINDPQTLASLTVAFERYEQALVSNDITVLDALFWDSPHTLRYGPGEHLYGYAAIQAFRRARPAAGLDRTVVERAITTFGDAFAVTHMVFSRAGQSRLGRQTQSWARLQGQWRIVAAHVSWMDL